MSQHITPFIVPSFATPTFRHYNFTPREDMTPVESAWCAHFFAWLVSDAGESPETYSDWPRISRHFTEIVLAQPTTTETGPLYSAGCAL